MTLKNSFTASDYIKRAGNFWKDKMIVCRKTAKSERFLFKDSVSSWHHTTTAHILCNFSY